MQNIICKSISLYRYGALLFMRYDHPYHFRYGQFSLRGTRNESQGRKETIKQPVLCYCTLEPFSD